MYPIHTLSNGIRVVVIPAAGPVCHCGLVINAGSRDEGPLEHGLAHFVEHTVFKGTGRRTASGICNRLDEVGGELNAYTTKEETAVHASFLDRYFNRAAELIADMVFHSTFPEREIAKEKDVIIDEISSYDDSPAELIFDDFEDLAFAGSPLGHNILGTAERVAAFTPDDARRFCRRAHATDQMAFAVWGNIAPDVALRVAERHFGSVPARTGRQPRQPAGPFCLFSQTQERDTAQAHVCLGSAAPSSAQDDRLPMFVLSSLLGGPSMNSRLSVALRERNGIAYNVETNYATFDDAGCFTIYFGTDAANVGRSLRIVRRELDKLCAAPLSDARFARVMRQYTAQMLMGGANGENVMLAAGRAAVLYNHAYSAQEMADAMLKNVSPQALLDVARQTLDPERMSMLIYK